MFTGIVQGMGKVVAIEQLATDFRRHVVRLPENMTQNLQLGASIAHNGCCLTISQIDGDCVHFDLMAETLAKTNLGQLKVGDSVNLERAARFGDEIGGHLMSGHIMMQTQILSIQETKHHRVLYIMLPEKLKPYILEKGFIGLDGCSLTIAQVAEKYFCVHLIPETLTRTLFGSKIVGDSLNVEVDAQTQAIVDTVSKLMAK